MKRLFTLIFSVVALLLATACTKEYITKEYITEEYYNTTGAQVLTAEYVVKASEWSNATYPDGRPYMYVTYDNPDITEDVGVFGYVENVYDEGEGLASWNPLPYVYPYTYETSDGFIEVIGENIRFEYEPGSITFVVEDLDAIEPDMMVAPIKFKIVIITNDVL